MKRKMKERRKHVTIREGEKHKLLLSGVSKYIYIVQPFCRYFSIFLFPYLLIPLY
jgi:hypothetical protein